MSISLVTREQASDELGRIFAGVACSREAFRRAYASEAVRSFLEVRGAASTASLLKHVRDVCNSMFGVPSNPADRIRNARVAEKFYQSMLRSLCRLGEIVLLSAEYPYYKQAPIRLITPAAKSKAALICGGPSNSSLSQVLGAPVHAFGFARFVIKRELPPSIRRDDSLWQNIRDWVGSPVRLLRDFTDETMNQDPESWIAGPPQGTVDVEVFAPESKIRKWLRLQGLRERPSGIRLCRATLDAPEYSRPTKLRFLATLSRDDGAITVSRSVVLKPNDGDRLVFGLEARNENSITVKAVVREHELELSFFRALPAPERKLLDLGVRIVDDAGERLVFPVDMLPAVEMLLDLLEVKLLVSSAPSG